MSEAKARTYLAGKGYTIGPEEWITAGGVPLANCVAAYMPLGAESQALSYINLVNPGTHDLVSDAAPTWDSLRGWIFDGATQYLRTGIIPVSGYSVVIRYANSVTNAASKLMGSNNLANTTRFIISNNPDSNTITYQYANKAATVAPQLNAAVLAITSFGGYRNGALNYTFSSPEWSGTASEIYIGSTLEGGTVRYGQSDILAIAVYNITLSAAQILAISTALAALDVPASAINITATPAASPLTITTYDGSGQTSHPSVVDFGAGNTWNGYRYWMANTPLPNTSSQYENPSIWASEDGLTWIVPDGLTNPIDPTPANYPLSWNADTELIFNDDTNELWCYWKTHGGTTNHINYSKSSNGVTWSAKATVINHDGAYGDLVSPTVTKVGAEWKLWAFNQNNNTIDLYTGSDGLSWTFSRACYLIRRPVGMPWHLTVRKQGSLYIMLVSTTTHDATPGIDSNNIYLAYSSDGKIFFYQTNKFMTRPSSGWSNLALYRPTFTYDGTTFHVWYAAVSGNDVWGLGYTSCEADLSNPS